MVARSEPIELSRVAPRFVSRGGEKLQAALDRFGVDVGGRRALDVGASTGGFTDCLLQNGVSSVVAVDVGHSQLHERLRADPRVISHERLDVRDVDLGVVGGVPFDVVTADLSFISATKAIPVLCGEIADTGAAVIILVKPQFEAGRAEASRGRGVIRDPRIHRRTLEEVAVALVAAGAEIVGVMPSPITGSAGNIEFLMMARAPGASAGSDPAARSATVTPAGDTPELLDAVVDEAQQWYRNG
jgi:23S rRNA (cytidine1920-2'-O)/16S rRNA (cytidine1409-2'-O)-methyltransferase